MKSILKYNHKHTTEQTLWLFFFLELAASKIGAIVSSTSS
jgi:hypothetical protein